MRVIDLLALLADQSKNASVLLNTTPAPSRFDDFILKTQNDQPQLIFKPKPDRKSPLRVWELQLLLNHPDLQSRFLYLVDADGTRALLALSTGQLVFYLTRPDVLPPPTLLQPFPDNGDWLSFLGNQTDFSNRFHKSGWR